MLVLLSRFDSARAFVVLLYCLHCCARADLMLVGASALERGSGAACLLFFFCGCGCDRSRQQTVFEEKKSGTMTAQLPFLSTRMQSKNGYHLNSLIF